MSYTGERMGVK